MHRLAVSCRHWDHHLLLADLRTARFGRRFSPKKLGRTSSSRSACLPLLAGGRSLRLPQLFGGFQVNRPGFHMLFPSFCLRSPSSFPVIDRKTIKKLDIGLLQGGECEGNMCVLKFGFVPPSYFVSLSVLVWRLYCGYLCSLIAVIVCYFCRLLRHIIGGIGWLQCRCRVSYRIRLFGVRLSLLLHKVGRCGCLCLVDVCRHAPFHVSACCLVGGLKSSVPCETAVVERPRTCQTDLVDISG